MDTLTAHASNRMQQSAANEARRAPGWSGWLVLALTAVWLDLAVQLAAIAIWLASPRTGYAAIGPALVIMLSVPVVAIGGVASLAVSPAIYRRVRRDGRGVAHFVACIAVCAGSLLFYLPWLARWIR